MRTTAGSTWQRAASGRCACDVPPNCLSCTPVDLPPSSPVMLLEGFPFSINLVESTNLVEWLAQWQV